MKQPVFFLINLIILFASCVGQSTQQANNAVQAVQPILQGDTAEELSRNIMVVYQDKKNNYWLGSWQDGLYKYDGHTIIHYTTKQGLPHNRIDEIKEDQSGNIYINTFKGISRYDGKRFQTLLENVVANNNWQLGANDLWFKSAGGAGYLYRYDGISLYKLKLPPTQLAEDYIKKHPNYSNPYDIYCIYKDSRGAIWFGTAMMGVGGYNGKTFTWISEPDLTEFHGGPANGIRSIAEDKNGDFWFTTDYLYQIYNNPDSTKTYARVKGIGSLDGKKNGKLTEYLSIIKDNSNHLWMVTFNAGVWKYDGTKLVHYPVRANDKNITLFCIYKDNKGGLWLGTHENGLWKFNGEEFERFIK
jgi:ligand-binding sensor domain-containing protein